MIYYVDAATHRGGDGTKARPFKWINDAAQIALPGDEIIVAPGVYREYVNPKNAGTEEAPIVYRSEKPLAAVITGAEPVKNWEHYEGDVWLAKIPNGLFGDYNPYVQTVWGDWYFSPISVHTGEIYLNGHSMYEMQKLEDVLNPQPYVPSWEEPEQTLYQWYTVQEENTTLLYANFRGADPNKETVEINVRRNCFYPDRTGVGYITLSGFTVKQAATTWAPPTAYQEGMIGPHWSKGWVIEDCEVSDSKCCGISLGKYLQPNNENKWSRFVTKDGTQTERDAICQAQREGWTKELIGSHTVRRCHIHHCEQTGIVGHLGGVFSLIEDNHIHHINTKQQLAGAEIAGIKMHAAIDVIFRRNHIHHCSRGLWLDWQAQGSRITQNLLHDNTPPARCKVTNPRGTGLNLNEDIFIEVSHGPTLIDNNVLLSATSGRLSTQGVAYVHNLIGGSFIGVGAGTDNARNGQPRYTPYHVPHRTEINGFMSFLHGDDRFYNNIFIQQEYPAEYAEVKDWASGTTNLVPGTHPFDEYPTEAEWKDIFFGEPAPGEDPMEHRMKRMEGYFHKLPVWTGGNVYFNGAKPCAKEENYQVIEHPVKLALVEKEDSWYLETDLYDYLPGMATQVISTETLGEAFEPEQKFENPDGTPIVFQRDYFDGHRSANPLPGPFVCGHCAKGKLF